MILVNVIKYDTSFVPLLVKQYCTELYIGSILSFNSNEKYLT